MRPPTRPSGWSLRNVCLEGPEELLTSTDRAQPALFALSYALWDEVSARLEGTLPLGGAGHSLGEYTALTAAGVLDYLDALSLVAARGAPWTKRRVRNRRRWRRFSG